jgi:DNA invertase Pin-like site-specific DNA recombinase
MEEMEGKKSQKERKEGRKEGRKKGKWHPVRSCKITYMYSTYSTV